MQIKQSLIIIVLLIVNLVYFDCIRNKDTIVGWQYQPVGFRTQIATFAETFAVVCADSSFLIWGYNYTGLLGNGLVDDNFEAIPRKIPDLNNITAVDLHYGHALAADSDGNIWYWGHNSTRFYSEYITEPVIISKLKNVVQIDIITDNFKLLCNDGSVWQIKWDYHEPSRWIKAERIKSLTNICQISEGMALSGFGKVFELEPTLLPSARDVEIANTLDDIKQIQQVYGRHSLVLKKDGTVWAWGRNSLGDLGDGTQIDKRTPIQVQSLSDIQSIHANYNYNCAIKRDGSLWYWGYTGKENDVATFITPPVQVPAISNVESVDPMPVTFVKTRDRAYWAIDITGQHDLIPKLLFQD